MLCRIRMTISNIHSGFRESTFSPSFLIQTENINTEEHDSDEENTPLIYLA